VTALRALQAVNSHTQAAQYDDDVGDAHHIRFNGVMASYEVKQHYSGAQVVA